VDIFHPPAFVGVTIEKEWVTCWTSYTLQGVC
jgi:hypothetical protein